MFVVFYYKNNKYKKNKLNIYIFIFYKYGLFMKDLKISF